MHSVRAEDVCELVWIEHDGGCPERQHEACELVREQLRRLEVHMGVDEAGHDVPSGCVDDVAAVVLPEPGDPAVCNGHVDVEPLACEHGQDTSAADDDVGGLVATGDGEAAGEVLHAGGSYYPWRRGRVHSPHACRSATAQVRGS